MKCKRFCNQDILTSFSRNWKASSFGNSAQNRNLTYFSYKGISFDGKDNIVATIVVLSGVHAREWVSIAAVLCYMENRENFFMNNPNIEFIFIPLLNPDGYELSCNTEKKRFWRKTYPVKGNFCSGTDLNRNFGEKNINWGYGRKESKDVEKYKCSQLYEGNAPFSAPEALAFKNLINDFMTTRKGYLWVFDIHCCSKTVFPPIKSNLTALNSNQLALDMVGALRKEHPWYTFRGRQMIRSKSNTGILIDWLYSLNRKTRNNLEIYPFIVEVRGKPRVKRFTDIFLAEVEDIMPITSDISVILTFAIEHSKMYFDRIEPVIVVNGTYEPKYSSLGLVSVLGLILICQLFRSNFRKAFWHLCE